MKANQKHTQEELLQQMRGMISNGAISANAVLAYEYYGCIDDQVVTQITAEIEALMINQKRSKSEIKKTFTILIEGLQNLLKHSDRQHANCLSGIAIHCSEGQIDIAFAGIATNQDAQIVQERVSRLNLMERIELKKHYMEVMSNGELSAKGGAGLGLITMVMKSSSGLHLETNKIDEDLVLLRSVLSV